MEASAPPEKLPLPAGKRERKYRTAYVKRMESEARAMLDDEVRNNALYYLRNNERRFVQLVASGMANEIAAADAYGIKTEHQRELKARRLMQRPLIRAAINQVKRKILADATLEPGIVVRELAMVGMTPIEDCAGRVTVSDKIKALQTLAQVVRLLDVNVHVTGQVDVVSLIVNSGKREIASMVNQPHEEAVLVDSRPSAQISSGG